MVDSTRGEKTKTLENYITKEENKETLITFCHICLRNSLFILHDIRAFDVDGEKYLKKTFKCTTCGVEYYIIEEVKNEYKENHKQNHGHH